MEYRHDDVQPSVLQFLNRATQRHDDDLSLAMRVTIPDHKGVFVGRHVHGVETGVGGLENMHGFHSRQVVMSFMLLDGIISAAVF